MECAMSDSGFSEVTVASSSKVYMSRDDCESPGSSVSRASSPVSLARLRSPSSRTSYIQTSSPVTPLELRNLTGNYLRLLHQASEKIANLTEEKAKLEREKVKQLRSSIETEIEAKRLLLLEKEWTQERKEMLAANGELAAELERLQREEEAWLQEKEEGRKEDEANKVEMQQELGQLSRTMEKKTSRWVEELKELRQSLANQRERTSVRLDEHFEMSLDAKEQSVETLILVLKEQLSEERGRRREAEEILNKFSNQLEIEEREKEAFIELSNKYIKTKKFEVLIENEDLKAKLANSVEKEAKILAELEKMNAEKKVLEQTILSEIDKKKRRNDFETLTSKLKELLLWVFFIRPIQGIDVANLKQPLEQGTVQALAHGTLHLRRLDVLCRVS